MAGAIDMYNSNYDPEILKKIRESGNGGLTIDELLRESTRASQLDEKVSVDKIYHREVNVHTRPSKDEYYICIAKAVSKRSTCLKRQYGAVIVKNDEIISTGYNGNPRGFDNCIDMGFCTRINKPHNTGDYSDCHSVHAEQNAMLSAARKDMIGATLYLYGEENGKQIQYPDPCPICHRMIINAGIKSVVS